jgi:hypothetical protein
MRARFALALQTQLALPLIPFCIDLFARIVLLRDTLEWYQLPDLWTFLVTYAFFCLGLMVSVNAHELATDDDANLHVELVRQRLLGYSIFSVTFAGGISFFRAFAELFPTLHISEKHGLALFLAVAIFAGYTMFHICRTHLSYVNRVG